MKISFGLFEYFIFAAGLVNLYFMYRCYKAAISCLYKEWPDRAIELLGPDDGDLILRKKQLGSRLLLKEVRSGSLPATRELRLLAKKSQLLGWVHYACVIYLSAYVLSKYYFTR